MLRMTGQKNNALQLDQQLLLQLLQSANERIQKQQQLNELQQHTIQNLTTEIQLLNEKVNDLTHKMFGRSKETLHEEMNGQLNLFEEESVPTIPIEDEEQQSITVQGHRRVIGTKANKISLLSMVEEDHVLALEEQACTHCGQQMKDIGRTKVREDVRFHPAKLDCLVHYQHTYCCKSCEKMGRSSFKKASVPKPLISNSLGSNSVVAETIRMKFGQKVPAYRQESYWQKDLGLDISRDNITNWHIKAVHNALDMVAKRFQVYLNQEDILHGDETTYRVIESAKSDTYYWQFCTGKESLHPMVYYHHDESRSGEVPKDFLKDFTGYLHCDGYTGYNALTQAKLVYCFAHARRKFMEAIPKGDKNSEAPAVQAVNQFKKWFTLEKKWEKLTAQERLAKRQIELRPLVDHFYNWLERLTPVVKSKLDKAVQYAQKIRSGFSYVFEDGRLKLTNNRAERNIKELVIGRKNWLHSTSLEGARTSGIILSVYKTAELNGLQPTKYLEFLFSKIPNLPMLSDEAVDALLPWQEDVKKICKE